MGSFFSPTKGNTFGFLTSYLADEHVYVKDASLLPFTPSQPQTYVDFYPSLIGQVLSFFLNGIPVGTALVMPGDGHVNLDIGVPKGRFEFLTLTPNGSLLKREIFFAKNYAMFLGVSSQSYDERLADIQLVQADQDFHQMRSGRLFNILGAFFEFPPPPGWSVQKYRNAILGDPSCGPGFTESFFFGGTKKGVFDTIKSITCQNPEILPAHRGIRTFVRTRAKSNPSDPGTRGFFITTRANSGHVFTPPHYRFFSVSRAWWDNAADIIVHGSQMAITAESLVKKTNSFIEGRAFVNTLLDGQNIQFSVEDLNTPGSKFVFNVGWPVATGNASAAASFLHYIFTALGFPDMVAPTYAFNGKLRIGRVPQAGKIWRITILSGSSLTGLGFLSGDMADISPDQLANPNLVTPVTLISGSQTFTDGVDFVSVPTMGQIVWNPSTPAITNIPLAGTQLTAAYTYQMRREIQFMVDRAKRVNDIINYTWAP